MTEAPKRIWIDVDQIIMGYEDDPQHVSPEDAEYILAAEHERLMVESRRAALEEAAQAAGPQQRKNGNGLWVVRRRKIAAAIRALAEKK